MRGTRAVSSGRRTGVVGRRRLEGAAEEGRPGLERQRVQRNVSAGQRQSCLRKQIGK
jgi:hypothetical protein